MSESGQSWSDALSAVDSRISGQIFVSSHSRSHSKVSRDNFDQLILLKSRRVYVTEKLVSFGSPNVIIK